MKLFPKREEITPRRLFKSLALIIGSVLFIVGGFVGFLGWCTAMPGDAEAIVTAQPDTQLVRALENHVRSIAHPRNDGRIAGYKSAELYIRKELTDMGYSVADQPIKTNRFTSKNVWVDIPGESKELVIFGAHYDSAFSTPGADDNASGVAVNLELARRFKDIKPRHTLRFVFFSNEEPPHFRSDRMGSAVMASSLRKESMAVRVMFSLEMLGYFDDTPGSQKYPPVLNLFYPDTGDFIAFVGNIDYRAQTTKSVETYREKASVEGYGFAGPSFVQGIDFSDHMPFWNQGFPAVMVTDTSFFRNPHYHKKTDTADTLDYNRMALVVDSLEPVVTYWANEH